MPDIEVTDEQRERLETVREDVEAAFVDTYGHARLEDALDYLLDTYTPPEERGVDAEYERIATAEYPQLQRIAADVSEVPGSGIDADEMRGKLLSELGAAELAERLAEEEPESGGTDETDGTDGAANEGDEDRSSTDDSDGDAEPVADDSDGDADGPDGDADDPEEGADAAGGGGGGGVLSAANRLLDEHDDKWRESDSGDEPYEVDLPDGSTEHARTRDDVRQLLFRHY